ncbi:hypothetical protein GE061_005148 [Apolygus lucorum]|uniref:Peptidase C45 hydrolase domain-containing protein n=1 Tax=Apolygus lucorum TaxID=248454 RepID=A0A8S9WWU8_APOLU|nr:hypothetical protein GE061_005148 [Apolygus lucorum]
MKLGAFCFTVFANDSHYNRCNLSKRRFTMSAQLSRRNCLPIIYARGSHYDVGYDIGRTFASLIQDYIRTYKCLNEIYIPLYLTDKGREVYDAGLEACQRMYPQYVRELQGTADGADVPFYKLFLMHLDEVLPVAVGEENPNQGQGCSTMTVNQPTEKLIGHTEDGFKEALNHVYIVKATITDSSPPEEFTAFCYPGLLPGYSMGFNRSFAFSVNILGAKYLPKGCPPRTFVSRALFAADSLESVKNVLRCAGGGGIADAMSLNLIFFGSNQEDTTFYNVEVGPSYPSTGESAVSIVELNQGENLFHCNRFLHLKTPELDPTHPLVLSSENRHCRKNQVPDPRTKMELLNLMGDTANDSVNIFRDRQTEAVWTIAVGVFNISAKTWSVYIGNPKNSDPLIELPLK